MIGGTEQQRLEHRLAGLLGAEVRILSSSFVGGGCINEAYRLDMTLGPFFLKQNSATRFPRMFQSEAKGLELLGGNSEFKVPKPLLVEELGVHQFLLMEWLDQGTRSADFSEQFGRNLAQLHQTSQSKFGLDHSNYIGSLPQSNSSHDTWAEFYWNERLQPQIRLANDSGLMGDSMLRGFKRFEQALPSIYPKEPPALLHGDLWSGNYGVAEDGSPMVFDPAVYYGHREMDLAMMMLFGGFSSSIFDAYHEHYPLEQGWRERIPVGQLYPLMVHVNLFGSSYCGQVEQVLSLF